MTSRKARGWQNVVAGAVTIVVSVVLVANDVLIYGISAFPIIGAGLVVMLGGFYELFTARQGHRGKQGPKR